MHGQHLLIPPWQRINGMHVERNIFLLFQYMTRLLTLLICALSFASTALAADLAQVYQLALSNDATYQSARYTYQAQQEKSTQGLSRILPTVALQGTHLRKEGGDFNNTYGIVLTQPLFRVGNWESYQQGQLVAGLGEIQFENAQQDLMLRVTKAYFDVLSAEDSLYFILAQKAAITEQLAAAKRNFDVGSATITDTNEAQARYDLTTAQEIAARNSLIVAHNSLQLMIGQPAGPLSSLRTDIQLSAPEPIDITHWTQRAEQQNFQVIGEQIALHMAESQTRQSRADHYPTVDLQAARNHIHKRTENNPFETGSGTGNAIQLQWTIPLFTGFATTSKTAEALATENKTRSDLDNARRQAIFAAQQSYLGVTSGLSQIKAYEAAELSSLTAMESNQLGYQVGIRINIDVLNAQQQLFSTRRDLAKARYETLLNGLKLKAAAGTLQENDLTEISHLMTTPKQLQ